MWKGSIPAVNHYLADEVDGALWYGHADMTSGARTSPQYGALDAYFPGLLALSGDVEHSARLQESSFRMWRLQGIEPEVLDYRAMSIVSPGYELRPEIVESAFYLSHYTHDPTYPAMGREILQDLIRWDRTPAGYASLKSVVTKEKRDAQPSYALAETFKYLYLLFDPAALDFDQTTFNTEAHPLRRAWDESTSR